jgi:hypothetical protein
MCGRRVPEKRADVIHAKEIVASETRINRLFESPDEKRWEAERGDGQISGHLREGRRTGHEMRGRAGVRGR